MILGGRARAATAAILVTVLATLGGAAQAQTFTYGGYTFDQDNSARTVTTISGEAQVFSFTSQFVPGAGFDATRTVGALAGGFLSPPEYPASALNVGSDQGVSIVELTFGGRVLPNGIGADLLIFEDGVVPNTPDFTRGPEFYAVSVRQVGATDYTPFFYFPAMTFQDPVYATTFELTDFGIPEGAEIDAIRVRNLAATDRIAANGQVGVTGNPATSPNFYPSNVDNTNHPTLLDPDLTYVVGLQNLRLVVPEPTSLLLLGVMAPYLVGRLSKRYRGQTADEA